MNELLFIAYYAPQNVDIDPDDVREFVARVEAQGYFLTSGYAWPFARPDNMIRSRAEVDGQIGAMCRRDSLGGTLHFWRYPFEFRFSLLVEPDRDTQWMLSVEMATLLGAENHLGERNSREFLAILKTSLQCYPPVYGCAVTAQKPPYPGDAFTTDVKQLYPVNFYGPSYVRVLGSDRLLAAPAFSSEMVANGILVVPSIHAMYTDQIISFPAIEQYLG
ncbi:MAG: hypothetical protein MJE77_39600 [Proteobacteria bacterium]|nr:hypothetical protein [Pseudomonadota bacterium]